MRRVAPSVIAREQLQGLLAGGVDGDRNIVSALAEAVTLLMVQELLESEQQDLAAVAAMSAATTSRSGQLT
jgi:hypothetical protein